MRQHKQSGFFRIPTHVVFHHQRPDSGQNIAPYRHSGNNFLNRLLCRSYFILTSIKKLFPMATESCVSVMPSRSLDNFLKVASTFSDMLSRSFFSKPKTKNHLSWRFVASNVLVLLRFPLPGKAMRFFTLQFLYFHWPRISEHIVQLHQQRYIAPPRGLHTHLFIDHNDINSNK